MFYIVTYDIAHPKRLAKALKICRRYLFWVSRSVFQGTLSPVKMKLLLRELNSVLDYKKDSLVVFSIRNEAVCKYEVYGTTKAIKDNFV